MNETKTILVIDDDPIFLGMFTPVLETAGYRVFETANGEEGMRLLKTPGNEIDLIIVDLVLEGSSGVEIIVAARRPTSLMKIIAISGVLRKTQLDVTKYLGAHAVLRKPDLGTPFPADEWLQVVRSVLYPEQESGRTSAYLNVRDTQ